MRHFLAVIGPIVGGWIVQTKLGWRFNFWLMFIFSVLSLCFGFLATPESVRHDASCRHLILKCLIRRAVRPRPPKKTGAQAHGSFARPSALRVELRLATECLLHPCATFKPQETVWYVP